MSAETVLERIEQEPITIDLENGRLRVRTLEAAPPDYELPTDLVDALREAVESLAIPESLSEFTEGVRRLNAQRHLDHLAEGRSLQGWKNLHGRLIKHWPVPEYYFCGYTAKRGHPGPQHDAEGNVINPLTYFGKPKDDPYVRNAWSNLCSWADAHLHVVEAERGIANRTLAPRTRDSAKADLSWNSRRLPVAEHGVVWHAMFDENFFQLLMNVKG